MTTTTKTSKWQASRRGITAGMAVNGQTVETIAYAKTSDYTEDVTFTFTDGSSLTVDGHTVVKVTR
jgi:hypothetical protein